MKLRYDESTEAFRRELIEWIESHPLVIPSNEPSLSSAHLPGWARAWIRQLYDAGWLVPGWPPELGGRHATPVQQMVYFEEMARRDVPRTFNPAGLSIITPSIIDFGTPEQRERFAIPSLRGEIAWCLGMSEPNAGSDLAALSTRAVGDGDNFVVNGQKVWTSGAQHADWCFCFVRTDPDVAKHQGISVLLIDMRSPGITVRELPDVLSKEHADFNEVYFDDVVVPADQMIGELNNGWAIAGGSLAHERGMMWIMAALQLESDTVRFRDVVRASPSLLANPSVRDRVAQGWIDSQALMLMGYKGFAKFAKGMQSPEHSVLKLFGSEARQRVCLEAAEAEGAHAIEADPHPTIRAHGGEGSWLQRYLWTFGVTISAGASEIQRNIVAERVLGLPRR